MKYLISFLTYLFLTTLCLSAQENSLQITIGVQKQFCCVGNYSWVLSEVPPPKKIIDGWVSDIVFLRTNKKSTLSYGVDFIYMKNKVDVEQRLKWQSELNSQYDNRGGLIDALIPERITVKGNRMQRISLNGIVLKHFHIESQQLAIGIGIGYTFFKMPERTDYFNGRYFLGMEVYKNTFFKWNILVPLQHSVEINDKLDFVTKLNTFFAMPKSGYDDAANFWVNNSDNRERLVSFYLGLGVGYRL